MLNIFNATGVTMLIGGLIAASSGFMYGMGKIFIDPRLRCLSDAPEIRDTSESGFGYIQGPLHTDHPIMHEENGYVRLDESIYHITTTKVIGYDFRTNEKRSDFEKKAEFVHRTIRQAKPIFVNNINIGVFIESIPLKKVDALFSPIGDYISNNSGQVTNVNIQMPSDNNHLLGEHEKQVIGIEHRRSGIRAGKVYTIFGYYDADKKKMKKSLKYYNIVSKKSRDDVIESEHNFSKGWKWFWGTGMFVGCVIGSFGYAVSKQ
jgi:hypothetical protein